LTGDVRLSDVRQVHHVGRSPFLLMAAFREAGRGISRMAEAKGP
jgi:hypothetical protein